MIRLAETVFFFFFFPPTNRYIQRFRSHSKLQGEAGYYLSSISGAIQFIETMDASSLSNITQPEFESHVEAAIQELPPSPSSEKNGSGMLQLSAASFRTPPAAAAEKDQGRERRERERDSKLISPFAAVTPGDEAARPLSMASAQASLEGTRKWFARTGNLAQEAVSKPLNAIGKILEGMSPADTRQGSEDGSGDDEGDGEGGGGGGGGRVQGMSIVGETSAGRGPGGVFPRDVFGSRRFRAVTPESPSRRPTFGDEGISRTCVVFFYFLFFSFSATDRGWVLTQRNTIFRYPSRLFRSSDPVKYRRFPRDVRANTPRQRADVAPNVSCVG